jgi:hypothetical protein
VASLGDAIAAALIDYDGMDAESIRLERREKFLALGRAKDT